jgi:hypothetical protein
LFEIMDRAGGAIFAAFDQPRDAVECAVTLAGFLAWNR